MAARYLFGPVTATFADENLTCQRETARCIAFNHTGGAGLAISADDSWESVRQRLPGWEPDFLVLYLAYTAIPPGLWSAPVPIIGLAMDWNLLWSGYRHVLPRCDLILTDSLGVDKLRSEGIKHVRQANLFGCARSFAQCRERERPRDIDVLFVGNTSVPVQRERLRWLGRLAQLSERWRVEMHTGVYGDAYRELLSRARIVFNRGIRGECNLRVFEAVSTGALLFQEQENREIRRYLEPGKECVLYNDGDFESLLDYYLEHESERVAIAEAARARIREFSFETLWDGIVREIDNQWTEIEERARQRIERCQNFSGRPPRPHPLSPEAGARGDPGSPSVKLLPSSEIEASGKSARIEELIGRTWQALASSHGTDPALTRDLAMALVDRPNVAALHNALGLVNSLIDLRNGHVSRSGTQAAVVISSGQPAPIPRA